MPTNATSATEGTSNSPASRISPTEGPSNAVSIRARDHQETGSATRNRIGGAMR